MLSTRDRNLVLPHSKKVATHANDNGSPQQDQTSLNDWPKASESFCMEDPLREFEELCEISRSGGSAGVWICVENGSTQAHVVGEIPTGQGLSFVRVVRVPVVGHAKAGYYVFYKGAEKNEVVGYEFQISDSNIFMNRKSRDLDNALCEAAVRYRLRGEKQ